MPQFLSAATPFLPQVAVLETTFVTLAILNTAAYALLASAGRACGAPSTASAARC